jgi:hypothetical protein
MIRADQTEEERQEDLAEQYTKLKTDPRAVIFCPWCSQVNRAPQAGEPDVGACCNQFALGVQKIGRDQLESVIRQQREILLGGRRHIHCPYCGVHNKPWSSDPADWVRPMVSPFCCNTLHDAALAVAQRMELARLAEQKKRIEDGVAQG